MLCYVGVFLVLNVSVFSTVPMFVESDHRSMRSVSEAVNQLTLTNNKETNVREHRQTLFVPKIDTLSAEIYITL